MNQTSNNAWLDVLDEMLHDLERSESGLVHEGAGRKLSGSYYTPIDVADHFWSLFFRHHRIVDVADGRKLVRDAHFVEPSVGSGMFLFTLIRRLHRLGLEPNEIAALQLDAVDVNARALEFLEKRLRGLETALGMAFSNVRLAHEDFLEWIPRTTIDCPIFVGNPPFVSNSRGARWRNLYADFLETMIDHRGDGGAISLLLPMSICFSRDYVELRRIIQGTSMPLSASSYDNIPDSLFKAGKPESGNTNKANSQRCTILNLGGPREGFAESSALLRWTTREREEFLNTVPTFLDCSSFDLARQIPRPSGDDLFRYLKNTERAPSLGTLLSRIGEAAFAVGGVARNYIGIRDYDEACTGVVPIRTSERDDAFVLLQVLGSPLFYRYWRTFGDGFHVTRDVIDRFPLSPALVRSCEEGLDEARVTWSERKRFAKTKRNSGKQVTSYDFSSQFGAVVG